MIRTKRFLPKVVAAIVVFVFLGTSGIWAEDGKESVFKPIAEEMIGAGGISWAPKVNYYQLVLTIARPDGSVFRKTFNSGATPYVGLSSIFGERAQDGAYTYELTLIPNIERRVRSSDDDTLIARTQDRKALPRKALTQSGGFTVKDGMIVTPEASEPGFKSPGGVVLNRTQQDGISRPQDQVILDDLIVDGSACIGMDCVNGESFGFDTIRIKENNLRIRAVDTSSTSSFPSRDWQITFNDSANGGANKFSIDDIDGGRTPFTIEAGAPSHSLYVDDGGRVGFGTSTPVTDLHVKSGNTPTLRLEQDGSSGFTPQTWDVAGNEANFFIRDATNGSTLPFRIIPGAPSNSLYIATDGDVGVGTTSPAASLQVEQVSDTDGIYLLSNSSTDAVIKIEKDGNAVGKITAGNAAIQFGSYSDHKVHIVTGTATTKRLTIKNTDGFVGIGDTNPAHPIVVATANNARLETSGNWVNPSSRELKENIESLTADEAIETLLGLNPVKYNYKVDKTEGYVGFIAEDVPELVAVKDRKGLVPMDVVAVLTKVVQQQQKSIREQQKTITELKKEIAELKKK
jgi:hypothetical protein